MDVTSRTSYKDCFEVLKVSQNLPNTKPLNVTINHLHTSLVVHHPGNLEFFFRIFISLLEVKADIVLINSHLPKK